MTFFSDAIKQCNQNGLKCIVHNKGVNKYFHFMSFPSSAIHIFFYYYFVAIIDSLRADIDCGCLEDCNVIKYSLQRSDTMLWFHNSSVSWTIVQTKVIYKRELIHGFVEALILTGASLSLYVGMSCLTLVELIFYLYLYAVK